MIALYLILENDSMVVKDILLSNIKYIEVNVGLIHQDGQDSCKEGSYIVHQHPKLQDRCHLKQVRIFKLLAQLSQDCQIYKNI